MKEVYEFRKISKKEKNEDGEWMYLTEWKFYDDVTYCAWAMGLFPKTLKSNCYGISGQKTYVSFSWFLCLDTANYSYK